MEKRIQTVNTVSTGHRQITRLLFLICFALYGIIVYAAPGAIKGKVTDTDGHGIAGVNVIEKGTTNGVITDVEGNYTLNLTTENPILSFSFIGYKSQETLVGNTTVLNIILKEDVEILEEVVVVGYGTQKKKLVTGATQHVNGDNIQKLNTINPLGALQSQTSGINIIQTSGMPGEKYKVTIRGLGTTGSSEPLYIVDGVVGASINDLNPSDIESIDVLKDAASSAIYGSRAANGVILVTTKQGRIGKATVTYDGSFGIQNIYKQPGILNAQDYITLQNESKIMDGNDPYDFASLIPNYNQIKNGEWNGTNWFDEALNKNAQLQNHALNIIGGGEQAKYSLGLSYANQEGIFGKPVEPQFKRYTFRLNTEYTLLKNKDLNIIKIGENMTFTHTDKNGIGIGAWGDNDLRKMLSATPLMPLYNSEGEFYSQKDKETDKWNWDPMAANPIALMKHKRGDNINNNNNIRGNLYLEIQPIKSLKFRSSFGLSLSANSTRKYISIYNLSSTEFNTEDQVSQSMSTGLYWLWDNTLSYNLTFNNLHFFDIMLGQSIEKSGMGESISGSNRNSLFSDFKYAYLTNTPIVDPSKTTLNGSPWQMGRLASFFGRINYNYKEKYMATIVLRADGSSNFDRGNRWGYFPSISAGWVVSNESFMEQSKEWLDFLKLRVSWGQNGNASISPFQYLSTISFSNVGYYFGADKTLVHTGAYPDIMPNKDVTWETSEQFDLGFDARFLSNRLGLSFDYYNKDTKDWLLQAPILASFGTNAPYINGGDVRNRGIELSLNWNDNINDFIYGININLSHNKNEVTQIANEEGIIHGATNVLFQTASEIYRAEVGYPLGYFYGYKTLGVFQNETEIANYKGAMLESTQPGDLIYLDSNEDGQINEDDKCMIGNPNPDLNLGLAFNFAYKGFDLSFNATGVFGNQIIKSYRGHITTPQDNFTKDLLNRWHGEGTSNKLPRLSSGGGANWQNISDIYVENGDYLRLQNITFGYDFKKLIPKLPCQMARLYISGQNLFTITKYSGMDPEVGYGNNQSWASGIDVGSYPTPRTFLFGINLKF